MVTITSPSSLELEQVAHILRARGETLGTAESCTGGLASVWLTNLPGSSKWFKGGVITYANELKTRFLGVSEEILREHGAVSEESAKAMAKGAILALQVTHSIAITGIAGPSGGSEEKPVGTVWLGASINGEIHAKRFLFPGDRAEIRARAAQTALLWLLSLLSHREQPRGKN